MGKFDRAVADLLDGAQPLWINIMIPSRDLQTDVGDGLWAVITDDRVVFLDNGLIPRRLHWWFWRSDLAGVLVEKRWQSSWVNKAVEYIVTFVLADGETPLWWTF